MKRPSDLTYFLGDWIQSENNPENKPPLQQSLTIFVCHKDENAPSKKDFTPL